MTKEEFLTSLGEAMQGKVPSYVYNENIRYYEEYIATGVRAGRSEEEVVESLGDPRLLAKSLIEASVRAGSLDDDTISRDEQAMHDGFPRWAVIAIGIAVLVILCAIFTALIKFILPVALVGFVVYEIYKYVDKNR